jgi:hypothetical protein
MSRLNKRALWEELDATNEDFVRQKYALGEYSALKAPVVSQWLAARDRMRLDHQAQEEARFRQTTMRWTKIAAIAGSVAVAATILVAFVPK